MNFDLTEEQQLLQDSVRRLLEKQCDFEERRYARVPSGVAFSRELWSTFAEMGWLGIGVPEEAGGLGGTSVEVALIAEEFGRALVLEPYVQCGVFPTAVIRHCVAAEHASGLLGSIA